MSDSMHAFLRPSIVVLFLGLCVTQTAASQGFSWPDESENLQVLPQSTTGEQLGNIMRSFTSSLGVRCSFCHVGEGPLTNYDFVSDEKEMKEKTRVMMRMTRSINSEYIAGFDKLEETAHERIQVTCLTCHRNTAKPMLLEDVLAQTYEADGIDEVLSSYDQLREAFYGSFTYNFKEGTLTRLGLNIDNTEAALRVFDLESELHPDFPDVYMARGNVLAEAGLTKEALASYEKGKSLASPRSERFFQERIDALKGN